MFDPNALRLSHSGMYSKIREKHFHLSNLLYELGIADDDALTVIELIDECYKQYSFPEHHELQPRGS